MVKKKPKKEEKEDKKKISKDSALEDKVKDLDVTLDEGSQIPLELADGITDNLEQVDVRSLLKHSGEEQQKTRAHLEEELGDTQWIEQEEDKTGGEFYGAVKKDSGEGASHKYENSNSNLDPLKKTYEALNLYEAHENFYDPTHTKVKDSELGEIRERGNSELEIQGISKERRLSTSDFSEGHPSDDYE